MGVENGRGGELCTLCREREVDRAESGASCLCADCRAERIRLRTPRWVEFVILTVCILAVYAVRQTPSALREARAKELGDAHFAAREYLYAYQQYAPLLAGHSRNLALAAQTMDAAIKAQWFGDAYGVLEEHLVDRTLSDEMYRKLDPDAQFLFRFVNTYAALAEGWGSVPVDEDADPEETRMRYEALLHQLLEDPEAEKAYLYYHLAFVQADSAEYERYMRLASEADPRVTYPLAFLGNARRSLGYMEEARALYARALEHNALDAGALRGQGIMLMIEGMKEEGLAMIRQAYSLEPLMQWMPEALYIALLESGLDEEADAIRQIAEQSGYAFDHDGRVAGYTGGEVTVAEYYVQPEEESL